MNCTCLCVCACVCVCDFVLDIQCTFFDFLEICRGCLIIFSVSSIVFYRCISSCCLFACLLFSTLSLLNVCNYWKCKKRSIKKKRIYNVYRIGGPQWPGGLVRYSGVWDLWFESHLPYFKSKIWKEFRINLCENYTPHAPLDERNSLCMHADLLGNGLWKSQPHWGREFVSSSDCIHTEMYQSKWSAQFKLSFHLDLELTFVSAPILGINLNGNINWRLIYVLEHFSHVLTLIFFLIPSGHWGGAVV